MLYLVSFDTVLGIWISLEVSFLARCYVVAKVYKVLYMWYSPSL